MAHRGVLRAGKHANMHLQKAWKKYEESDFVFTVLEEAVVELLEEREQYYLDTLKPAFNIREAATRSISGRPKKRGCTIRLPIPVIKSLKQAANAFAKSQSDIVEEALKDYFKKYNLDYRYLLHVTKEDVVLMKVEGDKPPEILEVTKRNGVSPEDMAQQYRVSLRGPVALVEYPQPGESTWPKKQS